MKIFDKIKIIKEFRTPIEERKIIDILSCLIKYENYKYPNTIFYKLDDVIVIEHNLLNNNIYFSDTKIFEPLYNTNECFAHTMYLIKRVYRKYNNIDYNFQYRLALITKEKEWELISNNN